MNLLDIPLSRIDLAPNVRSGVDDEEDEALSASLDETGMLQPVRVRPDPVSPGRYVLVVGSRRYAAASMAGVDTIPALVDERPPDPVRDAIEQLTENIQRQDLNPMDIAVALRRIMSADPSLSAAAVARRLGRPKGWAHRHLGLLRLAPEVQSQVRSGAIALSHVVPIVAAPRDQQVRLGRMAAAGVSTQAIEQAVYPSASSYTRTFGTTTIRVTRCPDDTRLGRIHTESDEPFATIDVSPQVFRNIARTLTAIAAAIEAEHGHEPFTRDRSKPTVYPATRRPAKRPRRPGVRGGPPA